MYLEDSSNNGDLCCPEAFFFSSVHSKAQTMVAQIPYCFFCHGFLCLPVVVVGMEIRLRVSMHPLGSHLIPKMIPFLQSGFSSVFCLISQVSSCTKRQISPVAFQGVIFKRFYTFMLALLCFFYPVAMTNGSFLPSPFP